MPRENLREDISESINMGVLQGAHNNNPSERAATSQVGDDSLGLKSSLKQRITDREVLVIHTAKRRSSRLHALFVVIRDHSERNWETSTSNHFYCEKRLSLLLTEPVARAWTPKKTKTCQETVMLNSLWKFKIKLCLADKFLLKLYI